MARHARSKARITPRRPVRRSSSSPPRSPVSTILIAKLRWPQKNRARWPRRSTAASIASAWWPTKRRQVPTRPRAPAPRLRTSPPHCKNWSRNSKCDAASSRRRIHASLQGNIPILKFRSMGIAATLGGAIARRVRCAWGRPQVGVVDYSHVFNDARELKNEICVRKKNTARGTIVAVVRHGESRNRGCGGDRSSEPVGEPAQCPASERSLSGPREQAAGRERGDDSRSSRRRAHQGRFL